MNVAQDTSDLPAHVLYNDICSKQYLITPKYKPDELTLTINHISPYVRE